MTTLCLHPDKVLEGTADVAKHVTSVVGESVAEPVVEHVAAPVASAVSTGLLMLLLALGASLLFALAKSGALNHWVEQFKAHFARNPRRSSSGSTGQE